MNEKLPSNFIPPKIDWNLNTQACAALCICVPSICIAYAYTKTHKSNNKPN